jgi:hypothetical protein
MIELGLHDALCVIREFGCVKLACIVADLPV